MFTKSCINLFSCFFVSKIRIIKIHKYDLIRPIKVIKIIIILLLRGMVY